MRYLFGIDGGGTAVRAALAQEDGKLLGLGLGGPANPKAVTLENAVHAVEEAIERAWRSAGLNPRPVDAAYLGIAGLRTRFDQDAFRKEINALSVCDPHGLHINHDLSVALAGALGGDPGIVVVVGTGSACYGCGVEGETARSGGWGWFIDDPGSGYWLGLQAMRAAARACDGRGAPTLLEAEVREFCRLRDINELPNIIYNPYFSRERIAELAPVVFKVAEAGDATALDILHEGHVELVRMIKAVVERAGLDPTRLPVTLTGGITQNGSLFWDGLTEELHRIFPGAQLCLPRHAPVAGAVLLAARSLGQNLSPETLTKLSQAIARATP